MDGRSSRPCAALLAAFLGAAGAADVETVGIGLDSGGSNPGGHTITAFEPHPVRYDAVTRNGSSDVGELASENQATCSATRSSTTR